MVEVNTRTHRFSEQEIKGVYRAIETRRMGQPS